MAEYREPATADGWRAADWVMTALYGLVILFLLPRTVIVRSDDFAYLEVTVRTIRTHWPAISDWFEANNVLFSWSTAAAYWLTGNFYLASYGVLAAFAAGAFVLLNLLIIETGAVSAAFRRPLAFVVVFMPVYLNKSLDFVGVIPAVFFFLLALLFYVRQQWTAFFLAVAGAFLTRETGLMLLILAGGEVLRQIAANPRDGVRFGAKLLPGFLAVAALAFAVKHAMPPGWVAQRLTVRALDHFNAAGFFARSAGALSVAFCALILFRAIAGSPHDRTASRYGAALLIVAGAVCVLIGRSTAISLEFPLPLKVHVINGYGIGLMDLVFVILALRGAGTIPRSPLALTQLAAVTIISARGGWWDYYLLEILMMSLLQALMERRDAGSKLLRLSGIALAAFALLIAAEGCYALYYKLLTERARLEVAVLEPHFRRHDISPQSVTNPPWGYSAWYLFEPYIQDNKDAAGASSFAASFAKGNLTMKISFSETGAHLPGCTTVESGQARLMGLRQFYAINRCGTANNVPLTIAPSRFFPQDNREWTDYIRSR